MGSAIRDDRLGDFGEKPGFAQFRVENDLIIPVPRKFSPMSRPTLAAVLAALLVASAVLAFAPAQAHAGPAAATTASERTEAVHPAASITYTILNGYDFATTSFYPGEPGWGALYFSVTDPLDSAVNVTIKDPNATRDGVPVPAFHYEATLNSTTHTFNSYQAGIGYSFPAALPYGGGWTVNFSAPNGGTVVQNVTTYVYFTELSTSVGDGSTLPGLPLTVFWSLVSEANGRTVYTHATNVWITGTYRGNGTIQNIFSEGRVALTPASAGQGEWTGTVPLNATPDSVLHFEVYAITNVSGVVAENESSTIDVYVGSLVIHGTGLTQAPPTCTLVNDYYFTIGTQIASCIEAGASYGGTFTPIAGLPVKVGYWNGTAHVSPSGAPTSLSTNALGEAAFTFNATSPPFIQESTYPGTDAVNFSVTLAGASALYKWTLWDNVSWTLYGYSPASGLVQVLLDHTQYYSGETANVTWSISTTNESKTGPVTAQSWEVVGPNAVVYQKGLLTGAGTTGTFTFPITAAMVPNTIYVYVYATNATEGFEGYASAVVDSPTLLLTPSALYYSAGTTTDVTAVLNGGGSGAQIQYQLLGYWNGAESSVGSGTVANGGSIPVVIASQTPPNAVEVYAWATVAGQVIATNSVAIILLQGYSILLGVQTASSYSDGSYQPGQTITLSYQVVSVGGAPLPATVSFDLIAIGYPASRSIDNVGPSGTISYTIPSNAVQGTLLLELEAEGALTAGTCFGGCVGVAALTINPNPSVLSMEIGAGSGVTVGFLILLILVIVVAIVVVLMLLRRRGGRGPSPASSRTTSAAPGEPVSEWTPPPTSSPPPSPPPEPEPATDNSPPGLPEPPPPPS